MVRKKRHHEECSQSQCHLRPSGTTRSVGRFGTAASGDTHAVLGVTEYQAGRIAVYGDSNCLDSSHMRTPCFRLLSKLLTYVATVRRPAPNQSQHRLQ